MGKILKAPIIVALLFCSGFFSPAFAHDDLDMALAAQERASHELEEKIRQHNETAAQKSRQARTLQARISDMQRNSQMAQQQIKLLELQSDKLQRSMNALDVELAEIARQVDALAGELRSRVVNIYKYGSREVLNLLLSAENAHEAIASAYLLERIARHDRAAIEGMLNKAEELGRGRRGVERNKARLVARTDELNIQRREYDAVISQASAQLSGVQKERQRAETAAKETQQAQLEIERAIAELMRRKKRPSPAAETGAKTDAAAETQADLAPGRAILLDWPVKGAIAGYYGPREHPDFKTASFNSGIDISVPSGTPVKAAGAGKVLYEGWLRGFGQIVIIDHGRGISTIYAHLASTRVKEKDAVTPGTVIGTVGGNGTMEGCNLHFEVRVGDSAKNPLDYLKKT